jgi:hypothetical protein
MEKLPPALQLLKDWSIWLVGLQTGVLGLVTFIGGKEGFFKLDVQWARIAIFFFAFSIIIATWVLAALPSILMRMQNERDNFYNMGLFEWAPFKWTPLWLFTFLQHILFVLGIFFFMLSITERLK